MTQEFTEKDFLCFEDENLLKGYIMYNFYYYKKNIKSLDFYNYYTLLKKNEIVAKNGKNSFLVNVKRLDDLRLEDCYNIYFNIKKNPYKELLKFLTNYYFVENEDLSENIIETVIPQLEEHKIVKENGKYLILQQKVMKNYNYVLYKNYYNGELVIKIENK